MAMPFSYPNVLLLPNATRQKHNKPTFFTFRVTATEHIALGFAFITSEYKHRIRMGSRFSREAEALDGDLDCLDTYQA